MTASRKQDLWSAAGVSALVVAWTALSGDPLYLGPLYCLAVFAVTLALAALPRSPPLFALGAVCAIAVTFLGYWQVASSLARVDGLLGLGHLFSLPGAAVGLLAAKWWLHRRGASAGHAMAVAFALVLAGFLADQWIICQSLMWCGPLSLS